MTIEKINFSYPSGSLQSVFDTQEMTALELAAKTSKKVDECVELVNGVEQSAIEATATVDEMKIAQEQFLTENADIRANMVADNQEYIDTLVASKTQFDTTMNEAVATVIANADATIQNDVSIKIEEMTADGSLANVINQEIFSDIQRDIKNISLSVKDYGAKGDGLTDDTTAINNSIADAVVLKGQGVAPVIQFTYSKGYLVSSTITIPSGVHVIMDAPIIYNGVNTSPCLVVGETRNVNFYTSLKLDVYNKNQSDWTNDNNVGIKLFNCNSCDINIMRSNGFTIALQCMGSGQGFAYNNIKLGLIFNGKIAVDLNCETNGTLGYCNENIFVGGRLSSNSITNPAKSRYGVRITSKDLTYTNNNNNVFLKPCFEVGVPSSGESIPILIEYGSENHVVHARNEGNGTPFMRVLNSSALNTVDVGYGGITVEDNSNYPTTVKTESFSRVQNESKNVIFDSGNVLKNACYYDGATNINIKNVGLASSSNSAIFNKLNSYTLNADNIEFGPTRGIGIFVDTRNIKEFVVKKCVVPTFGGRVYVACYDEAGNLLTSAGAKHPYVKGTTYQAFNYSATFGGAYGNGSDSAGAVYFKVGDDVAYVRVIVSGGTQPIKLKSFQITTLSQGVSATWVGYDNSNVNIATTTPTIGTWETGKIIYKATPISGGFVGWVCVDGATNTWKEFGLVGVSKISTQANSTAIDVATLVADFNALLTKLKTSGLMG